MILTHRTVDLVADRIERAYCRRHQDWVSFTWDSRIWPLAARALLDAHRESAWLPVDPELFVASQICAGSIADPWSDLAPPQAIARYRRRIVQLIRRLRRELRRELHRAENALRAGDSIDCVVQKRKKWLSPLGRYLLAYRAGRDDLLETLRPGAQHQHDACPLYRRASLGLIPDSAYPTLELVPGVTLTRRQAPLSDAISLN